MAISSGLFDHDSAGEGEQSKPWKEVTENSNPWFASINVEPRGALDDQGPSGEEVRLSAGSKEIGAYNKVVIDHVPFGPVLVRNTAVSQERPQWQSWKSKHDLCPPRWKRAEVQNKSKKQRLGRKHQAKLLNKTPGTAPTCWASWPPLRNTFSNESSFKVVMVHLYTISGKPLIQLHHNTVVYI